MMPLLAGGRWLGPHVAALLARQADDRPVLPHAQGLRCARSFALLVLVLVSVRFIIITHLTLITHSLALKVEHEWLSFGHQFAERCGHADDDFKHDQRAPIFIQWSVCWPSE